MKNVAVFFRHPDPMGPPFNKNEYWNVYLEMTDIIQQMGGTLYVVRGQESYLGNGEFRTSWRFIDEKLVETGRVKVSAIFNKGRFQSDNTAKVFNDERVSTFCVDKWFMYNKLKKYCPPTYLVQTMDELRETMSLLRSNKAVYKPLAGSEGKGVHIDEKEQLLREKNLQFPGVLQEFLDTSVGIPNIIEGLHDFRVAIFDGAPCYAYVRTPPVGSYLANVAQGGTYRLIDPKDIPKAMLDICMEVDKQFVNIPHRFYSVDFGNTAEGPKIIEMNSELGLFVDAEAPVFAQVKRKIAQVLMED